MAVKERSEVSLEHTWDLSPMYQSDADWETHFSELESQIPEIAKFQGRLTESAQTLREALDSIYGLSNQFETLACYSRLQSDVDTSNAARLGTAQKASKLLAKFGTAMSFFRPELLAADSSVIDSLLGDELLADYKFSLEEILRFREHTLTSNEERLLSMASMPLSTPARAYSQLNNADLKFKSVTIEGKDSPLTHSAYSTLIKHPNRNVREQTFNNYYAGYESHKNTIAATLAGSYEADVFRARAKNFSSARDRALFIENIDASVYDQLVDTVSENLTPLHDYYHFRKEALGVKEQRIFDTYVPLVPEAKVSFTYDESVEILLAALKPLGDEYCNILHKGLTTERWVDRYENKGKRSGAYSSGCYGTPPYMLCNFDESDARSLFTLAHEAGHSMHSYYSWSNQPYQYSSYTIFVAEVASTFNEQLLSRYLREKFKDDDAVQTYLVNNHLDDIKATLYRQTMFAEFEKLAHEWVESGQALTIDSLTEIYSKLLHKYFGEALTFKEIDSLECLRIPHFYNAFYVYKYATGISAAIALSKRVVEGGNKECEDYFGFLKGGDSKYSLDLLKDAGVDMLKPEPVKTACDLFTELAVELRKLWK